MQRSNNHWWTPTNQQSLIMSKHTWETPLMWRGSKRSLCSLRKVYLSLFCYTLLSEHEEIPAIRCQDHPPHSHKSLCFNAVSSQVLSIPPKITWALQIVQHKTSPSWDHIFYKWKIKNKKYWKNLRKSSRGGNHSSMMERYATRLWIGEAVFYHCKFYV